MKYILALVAALVLNATANLLMKIGAKAAADSGGLLEGGAAGGITRILTTPALLFGLTCFALNAGLYIYALQSKTLQISLAYPVMVGGGYAIIAVLAFLLPGLNERMTLGQWCGVGLILAGVLTVAFNTKPEPAEDLPAVVADGTVTERDTEPGAQFPRS